MKRFFLFLTLFFFIFPFSVWGKEKKDLVRAKVISLIENKKEKQKLDLVILEGKRKGERLIVDNETSSLIRSPRYQKGDLVWLVFDHEENRFLISDFDRSPALIRLFFIFLLLTLLIARGRGFFSLLGTAVSFLVIIEFILPQINQGRDPVFVSLLASLFLVPVTFYLSHGLNRKTTVAVLGSLAALFFTLFLAQNFIQAGHLSGFASDEASFVWDLKGGKINIKGLLLAGIIIGVLGILDDITIAQAAVVEQLRQAGSLSPKELFWRGMKVGQDHIASMVNTLILVYAGASLPLLLLFLNNPQPFSFLINQEIIAEEIVRTLVASSGLVAAVPLTTALAAFWTPGKNKKK